MSLWLFLSRHNKKYIKKFTSCCLVLLVSNIPGVLNTNLKTNWRVNTNFWISELVVKGCCIGNSYILGNVVLVERVVYQ